MKSNTLSVALALLLVLALCLCLIPAAFAEELNVSDAEVFGDDKIYVYDGEIYVYDEDTYIRSVSFKKGDVIELVDYDMTSDGKVLIGWSLVKGRNVADYTVGQGYTPTENTTFYAVSRDAVTITFVVNGNSSNKQIVAESTNTELQAFESMGIDPPGAHYFKQWVDEKGTTYRDRQIVSFTEDVVLTAEWAEAEEPAPAAPSQVTVTHHLVNYENGVLNGHSGRLSGLDADMEYFYNGKWEKFPISIGSTGTIGVRRPYNFEIRYSENTSTKTPPSKSVFRPMYTFVSEASAPVDSSTLREEIYSYDVNIYSVRPSGAKTLVDFGSVEWDTLQEVLSTEEIYFLLNYPDGITQDSKILTLMHNGRPVEIQQLSKGILGKASDFSNPEFVLYVEDRLSGDVELSDTAPKAGETITTTLMDSNLVGKVVYRWLRDGIPFTEYSASNSYTLTGADLMHRLSCEAKSANTPPTPAGSVRSAETTQVRIDSHETGISDTTSYIGYFEGVTSDMEYSTNDGISWRPVSEAGVLQDNKLYVSTPAPYIFRYRGETNEEYWVYGEIEAWYTVGYNISTSSTDSGSGTVTFRNGTTTLTSSSRITDSSGRIIIQAEGTNRWRVRMGSNTNINMVVRPSGSSSSSSSPSPYATYADVSLNGGEYTTFTGERTFSLEPVDQNKIYTVVFYRSASSPKTDIILEIPSGTKQIEEEAFAGGGFSYVRIRNNAITIGSRAFADCPNLSVVEIPASVRFIADDAFENDGDLIIGGIRSSYAESYANRKGYSFVAIATLPAEEWATLPTEEWTTLPAEG